VIGAMPDTDVEHHDRLEVLQGKIQRVVLSE